MWRAKRCFQCYSLEEAIHADPEIAQGILETMKCDTTVSIRMLVWRGKHGAQTFMARSDTELKQSYLRLFKIFNDEGFYGDMGEAEESYYELAAGGDAAAARLLIELRSELGYEYEDIRLEYAEVPQ